jgi:SRSO17 transposase
MDLDTIMDGADRFATYVEELTSVIGHADRAAPLRDYCAGLLTAEGRKSVEPMAAVTAPAHVSVQHQKLLHFVGEGRWSDERVLAKVRELVMPAIERHGPIEAWIIDDTSYPKQGTHSVGVHHQYCGQLGKQANCQVAVTLSIANRHASLPIAYRLYLPKDWADDAERRDKAHVPEAIRFKTKPQIALAQIRAALAAGVARGVVLIDASYGTNTAFRTGIGALGLTYVAAILSTVKVRAAADPNDRVSVKALALGLANHAWRTITWREGSGAPLRSRFARVRVRIAPSRGAAGDAADRVAAGRSRAHQVLALQSRPQDVIPSAGRYRQNALAHRARLPGTQAGDRARPLRRARMARLPSSRYTVYRRLRIPDLRTGDDSPLGTSWHPEVHETCHSRWLPTPRRRRSDPNGTSPTRSQRSIAQ